MSRDLRAPRFAVTITAEMIAEAKKRNSSHCMLADGIGAARPSAGRRAVDLATIRFSENGRRYTYLTPRRCQVHLVKWDQGLPVEPFAFQLRNGISVPAAGGKREKATLVKTRRAKHGSVLDRVGGRTPPRLPPKIRAYGLRALEL